MVKATPQNRVSILATIIDPTIMEQRRLRLR